MPKVTPTLTYIDAYVDKFKLILRKPTQQDNVLLMSMRGCDAALTLVQRCFEMVCLRGIIS